LQRALFFDPDDNNRAIPNLRLYPVIFFLPAIADTILSLDFT
jgi:hypothetical protein